MALDLGGLFSLDVSAFELILRTSVIYLALIAALRILGRREMGSFELPDLLLIVLIADGVQNGMAGEYTTISGGLIVAGTLIGWNYALDYATFRWSFVRRLLQPAPLILVRDGQFIRKNMRRELVSREELLAELRAQGIDSIADAQLVRLEHNGELSVQRREKPHGQDDEQQSGRRKRRAT